MTGLVPAAMASASAVSAVAGIRRLGRGPGEWRLPGTDLFRRTRRGRDLAAALQRAGVRLGPEAFVAVTALAAVLGGLATWLLLRTSLVAVAAAGAVGGSSWALVSSADRRYLHRFSAQLPIVAQQLASAIGAGLSLRQAIARAAADAPEPAATELRRLSTDLDLGARIETALEATVERLPDPGLRTMVIAVLVQRVAGGNLSQALADLSRRLEERAALEREARSATAQARMSAWLVAGLPMAGGVLVEIAAPGTLARTLGQGPGLLLVIVATALQIVGVTIIRRIIGREGTG
jgi:tight adherence protein B